MTIFIYETDGFDEGNYTLVDQFVAETNKECEDWAAENYGDTDTYAWSYTKA